MDGDVGLYQLDSRQRPHKAIVFTISYAIHYFALETRYSYRLHCPSFVEDLIVAAVVSRLPILEISCIAKGVLCAEPKYDAIVGYLGESKGVLYSLVGKYLELVDEVVPSVLADPLQPG